MWKTVRGVAFGSFIIFLIAIGSGWNPLTNGTSQKTKPSIATIEKVTTSSLEIPKISKIPSSPTFLKKTKIEKDPEAEDKVLKHATLLLQLGDVEGALSLIHQNEDKLTYQSDAGKKWVDLFITVSEQMGDFPQLVLLYRHFPQAFDNHEKASLLIGNAFISSEDYPTYLTLRNSWKGKETLQQEWLLLDVDALLLNGKPNEAIKLLQSRTFIGAEESGRLVRLALLNIVDNPKAAWDYLSEASIKDPQNSDIHIYRARLLESVDKKALAQNEYLAAVHLAPENIFLKDQLADFYLRNGQYQPAMSIWLETFDGPTLDTIWLKTLFWSRMITPVEFNWNHATPPAGKLQGFNRYLMGLAPGQFWDQNRFSQLQDHRELLITQQAVFWLRLLNDLQKNREDQALELLQASSFGKESWDPSLENAIKQLLIYRKTGLMTLEGIGIADSTKKKWTYASTENPFFIALNAIAEKQKLQIQERRNAVPEDLQVLLNSPEAFTIAFISAGWFEAGLQLHKESILPKEMPAWVAVVMAQALNNNRGSEEALKYAMMQPITPELSNLTAELLKHIKNDDAALLELQKMSFDPSETGVKAAWMVSLIYLERGDVANAKKAIEMQPRLAESLLGVESLARIALSEGDVNRANELYQSIEEDSPEAKSYLAQKAFKEKDWEKARLLTSELIKLYPDNVLLQENLKKLERF